MTALTAVWPYVFLIEGGEKPCLIASVVTVVILLIMFASEVPERETKVGAYCSAALMTFVIGIFLTIAWMPAVWCDDSEGLWISSGITCCYIAGLFGEAFYL